MGRESLWETRGPFMDLRSLVFSSSPLPSPVSFLFFSLLPFTPTPEVRWQVTHHPIQPLGPWQPEGGRAESSRTAPGADWYPPCPVPDLLSFCSMIRTFFFVLICDWEVTSDPNFICMLAVLEAKVEQTHTHTHMVEKQWWIKIKYLQCLLSCHTWLASGLLPST